VPPLAEQRLDLFSLDHCPSQGDEHYYSILCLVSPRSVVRLDIGLQFIGHAHLLFCESSLFLSSPSQETCHWPVSRRKFRVKVKGIHILYTQLLP
jgi:hypothetical protein